MTTHTPFLQNDLDYTLDFWESGPIRQLLEMQFEITVLEEARKKGIDMTAERRKALHDRVIPAAFDAVLRKICAEPSIDLGTRESRIIVQGEVRRLIRSNLGPVQGAAASPQRKRRVSSPFSWLRKAMRSFFPRMELPGNSDCALEAVSV